MKKAVLIILAAILLALIVTTTGCSRKPPEPTDSFALKQDSCLGAATWGMSKDEVKALLGPRYTLTDYTSFADADSLMIEEISFLGERAAAIYTFMKAETEGSPEQLSSITLVFPGEADKTALTGKVSAVLGDIETVGVQLSGNRYDLAEENYYWHAKESIYDALNEQGKQAAFQALQESMKDVREIDRDYADWWFSQKYLTTARFEETPRFEGLCLVLSGEGYLMAKKLNSLP